MIDFDKIWVEKYRPAKLDDIILDERTLNIVREFKDEIPNLLFVGNPGTGKTTLARVIVNDILGCNYLYINASDESINKFSLLKKSSKSPPNTSVA